MSDKKETLENITFEGQPIQVYLEEEERKEIDVHIRSEIRDAAAGTGYHPPTGKFKSNTSGARTEQGRYAKTIQSPEVLAHLNFLQLTGGREMVTNYLNQPQVMDGSIESAVKDASNKVAEYTKEALRLQAEAERWTQVRNQLLSALELLKGKVTVPSGGTGTGGSHVSSSARVSLSGVSVPRGGWETAARKILAGGVTMTKEEFRLKLSLEVGYQRVMDSTYASYAQLKKKGVVEEVDGLVGLCGG